MNIFKKIKEDLERFEKMGGFTAVEKLKEEVLPAIERIGGFEGLEKLKRDAEPAIKFIGSNTFISSKEQFIEFYRKTPSSALEQIKKSAEQVKYFEKFDVFGALKNKTELFGHVNSIPAINKIQESLFLFSETDTFNELVSSTEFNLIKSEVLKSTFDEKYTTSLVDEVNESIEGFNIEKLKQTVNDLKERILEKWENIPLKNKVSFLIYAITLIATIFQIIVGIYTMQSNRENSKIQKESLEVQKKVYDLQKKFDESFNDSLQDLEKLEKDMIEELENGKFI